MASPNREALNLVSLSPSAFEEPDISSLSLEGVVALFKDAERRRNERTEPEDDAEVRCRGRYSPVELRSSLRVVASRLNISVRLLTKCLAHQVIHWYTTGLGLDKLMQEHWDIYCKIKLRAYTTLRIQAEHPARFSLAVQPESCPLDVSSIGWVQVKLSYIGEVVGASGTDLLLVGLAHSITTLEHQEWDMSSIERFFLPEVRNMEMIVRDRFVDLAGLRAKYEIRESLATNQQIVAR